MTPNKLKNKNITITIPIKIAEILIEFIDGSIGTADVSASEFVKQMKVVIKKLNTQIKTRHNQ